MIPAEIEARAQALDEAFQIATIHICNKYQASVPELGNAIGVPELGDILTHKRMATEDEAAKIAKHYLDFSTAEQRDVTANGGKGLEQHLMEIRPNWFPQENQRELVSEQDVKKAESMNDADLAKFLHSKGMI